MVPLGCGVHEVPATTARPHGPQGRRGRGRGPLPGLGRRRRRRRRRLRRSLLPVHQASSPSTSLLPFLFQLKTSSGAASSIRKLCRPRERAPSAAAAPRASARGPLPRVPSPLFSALDPPKCDAFLETAATRSGGGSTSPTSPPGSPPLSSPLSSPSLARLVQPPHGPRPLSV